MLIDKLSIPVVILLPTRNIEKFLSCLNDTFNYFFPIKVFIILYIQWWE